MRDTTSGPHKPDKTQEQAKVEKMEMEAGGLTCLPSGKQAAVEDKRIRGKTACLTVYSLGFYLICVVSDDD